MTEIAQMLAMLKRAEIEHNLKQRYRPNSKYLEIVSFDNAYCTTWYFNEFGELTEVTTSLNHND